MLKPLSKVQLAIYIQLLERPEILASRYYEVGSYKQGVGLIYEMLMNAFVGEVNNAKLRDLIAFTYFKWKRENVRQENDVELLPLFVKILRKDFGQRCQLEAAIRGEE